MSDIKDGGPAFPQTERSSRILGTDGMTLRDWFAGQLAAATVSSWNPGFIDRDTAQHLAKTAYQAADAMLKEREQDNE